MRGRDVRQVGVALAALLMGVGATDAQIQLQTPVQLTADGPSSVQLLFLGGVVGFGCFLVRSGRGSQMIRPH